MWISYAPFVQRVAELSSLINNEKRYYPTAKYLTKTLDPHTIGKYAEFVYAVWSNQVDKVNMDWIYGKGDGGSDFGGVDVKGNTFWHDPDLIVDIKPLEATRFVLVPIKLDEEVGYVAGWATREEVLNAPIKDYGYGPRYSIHHTKLHDMSNFY